ncbi:cilia- and flagella-associated protein 251 isoform X2 [Cephus cinctus]|uniref:Cilia- and flagella-associated protein 251 n=1 Tax=Cephus cinctus TaxID=211228 RepID=A0AAJ7CBW9_CEPCN|nr:cilia- and flagella-associated protein 251 isoform X2 [Cephus cinctus]
MTPRASLTFALYSDGIGQNTWSRLQTRFKNSKTPKDDHSSRKNLRFHESATRNTNICPFRLKWSFGLNSDPPLVNLTTENRTLIAYGSSHSAVLYDYTSRDMMFLQGHKNTVRTLSSSKNGKWLLTADFDEDCVVVVWDTEKRLPICTLFNPHGTDNLTAAKISPNAKYLVTVGNEICQKVKIWLWTYGRDTPDGVAELTDMSADRVKEITFSNDYSEQFILTMEQHVVFVLWENDKLEIHQPKLIGKIRRLGIFNDSSYTSRRTEAFTATSNGFVLVWNGIPVDCERDSSRQKMCYMKKHIKSIHLQNKNITQILDHKGTIVTGNSSGHIYFYDYQLKLLFWCRNLGLDSIRSISFDVSSKLQGPTVAISESTLTLSSSDEDEDGADGEEVVEDNKNEYVEQDENDEQIKQKTERSVDSGIKELIADTVIDVDIIPKVINFEKYTSHDLQGIDKNLPKKSSDATLNRAPFKIDSFCVCTSAGRVAWIEFSKLKCHFLLPSIDSVVTALTTSPYREYFVTGSVNGRLSLYNYSVHSLMVSRMTPPIPSFCTILDQEIENQNIVYVTCPQTHKSMTAVTSLKYTTKGDMLVCGMESGALWMLHPDTLDPLSEVPYKHSSSSILNIIFSKDSEFMAYTDNSLTVVVFKRNKHSNTPIWYFLGKSHSHYKPIKDIMFSPSAGEHVVPRLFSLGEDRELVEYDLEHSGPYPKPGLKILEVNAIEHTATPCCLTSYPHFGIETFLLYKYRLLNDMTKMIRRTILGPTFGTPIQKLQVLPTRNFHDQAYMVFATEKEIGIQLLPTDGNPFMNIGMIGHPKKIIHMSISHCNKFLFTLGANDRCVLMWKINLKSVDVMAKLGGKGLTPFYCLVEGGSKGWLMNEIQDLFYYAQILHQGENTTATRIVSDRVSTKQLPNLMRAIGFYPSNYELENMMSEIAYKNYAETGQQVEEITFKELVKLYVNHRPVRGISLRQFKEAFLVFADPKNNQNPTLTKQEFLQILFGKGKRRFLEKIQQDFSYGEPLSTQKAYEYLKLLIPHDEVEDHDTKSDLDEEFNFLPTDVSYKNFVTNIMGIELPLESRAMDNILGN